MTEPVEQLDAADPRWRRRRRLRGRLALVAGVVLVWLAACAVILMQARDDASNGLASISVAERQTRPSDLLEGRPVALLDDAEASFASARDRLKNPVLTPIRWLPVAGRQLRAATAMADAATEVAAIGSRAVADAKTALDAPHETAEQRIAILRVLSDVAAAADRDLGAVDLGPSRALVGPLADKRAELDEKLGRVKDGTSDAAVAAKGLADLLQGPRRYLVLAANNAEMRAGAGMFLSAGELIIENGRLSISDFRPTGDIGLDADEAPPIGDADFDARWGFLNPNQEWRNLALTPRFEASAQLAARMWEVVTGRAPDGVLVLDPVGLELLAKAIGVQAGTGPNAVPADRIVEFLTYEQYRQLPPPSRGFDVVQAARREQLGRIAASVVDHVSNASFDLAAAATALADAAKGRHLLAWSARPDDGEVWRRSGVVGELTDRSLAVAVLNRGGNKLDRFLDVEAQLILQPSGDDEQAVLTLTLTNKAPENANVYVAGPYPGSGVGAGDYTGFVSVNIPGFASGASVDGFDTFLAAGPDGPTQVVAVPVTLARGASTRVVVRFVLPPSGTLRVEPPARVPTVRWRAPGQSWADGAGRTVRWG